MIKGPIRIVSSHPHYNGGMDNHTVPQRSRNMARIRSTNTDLERKFRAMLWRRGVRGYRLNSKVLIGKPDIYFSRYKTAVFIDGCFWHQCPYCKLRTKSNNNYWDSKFERNRMRDIYVKKSLEMAGIRVIRIWEHSIRENLDETIDKLIYQLI